MSITAARLQAEVGADTKQFDQGMAHADKTVAAAPSKWGRALKVGAAVGLGLAAGVVVKGLAGAISAGFASLRETGVVVAQTQAVIKSTGGSAHVTANQIRQLSERTEQLTAIDDKAVQAGANMLLTFTGIRNEVGKGNDIFNQSVAILADMSTAMGTDMKSGAIQLGKALNDPVKGITALTRVGVTFTDQQKKQIENFEKAGKLAEAQKVILAELRKEFGGSGAAFAATDAGQAAKFQDAIEGIQQSIAKGLLPVVTRVRGQLTSFLSDPATIGQAEALGDAIAGIFSESNLRTAANVMTTAAGAISTAVKLFGSLPPEVQALAVGAIGLKKITGIGPLDIAKGAGGIFKMVFERGATPANPLFVADIAGGAGLAGAAKVAGGGLLATALPIAVIAASVIGPVIAGKIINDNNSAIATGVSDSVKAEVSGGATLADLQKSLAAVDTGLNDLNNSWGAQLVQGDAISQLEKDKADLQNAILLKADTRSEGANIARTASAAASATDTRSEAAGIRMAVAAASKPVVKAIDALHQTFRTDLHALTAATKANDIQKAAKAIAADINKGVGSVKGTKTVLSDLKLKLTQTDDPKTRAVLQAAIRSVQAKLPNREWVAGEFRAAKAIEKSSESQKAKIADLTAIQRTLRDRGDTHAASLIGKRVDALKGVTHKVETAARNAGTTTAAAVRRKRWQFTNNITVPVVVNSVVALRSYSTATARASTRGNVNIPS